jgi:hypothetical protein
MAGGKERTSLQLLAWMVPTLRGINTSGSTQVGSSLQIPRLGQKWVKLTNNLAYYDEVI